MSKPSQNLRWRRSTGTTTSGMLPRRTIGTVLAPAPLRVVCRNGGHRPRRGAHPRRRGQNPQAGDRRQGPTGRRDFDRRPRRTYVYRCRNCGAARRDSSQPRELRPLVATTRLRACGRLDHGCRPVTTGPHIRRRSLPNFRTSELPNFRTRRSGRLRDRTHRRFRVAHRPRRLTEFARSRRPRTR